MAETVSTFDRIKVIRIGIASPQDIRNWSYGEVKKPETINYRTFKPERDGLFCERIFGPVKDWECHCGRYKKIKYKGVICDRCGVEVTRNSVRRERMGHIELAAPVCHIWYLKGVPSPLSLLLDISPRPLEKVLYFAEYAVTHVDRMKIVNEMQEIQRAVQGEVLAIEQARDENIAQLRRDLTLKLRQLEEKESAPPPEEPTPPGEEEQSELEDEESLFGPRTPEEHKKQSEERVQQEQRDAQERIEELQRGMELIQKVEKRQLIKEEEYRALERLMEVMTRRMGRNMEVVRAGMGAAAIKELLQEIDLEKLARELRQEISMTQGPKRARAIKRLEVAEAFINSRSRPEWMILDVVPVISPELRPMVQLDGGRFATSDLNDLYRRIINRNNRLKKITEIRAPESIVNHEKRLLQEAVDALIDNGRRTRPVVGSNNRPLKSLSDMLKGKEGRFRKNLLGKRVDYSGRSVIVVGPSLKLHQCGLPKEMALELFKPFVMKTLVERQYTANIKTAKRMIERMKPEVWDTLEEVIREHPVLLNRAPTLHRLGIQAFEPVLVDGKAIQVHPLVCHAFNADFDGDQMAVHIPLSASAQAEARVLMLASHNLFSPADGRPIVAPIQDIVLGSYYLTIRQDSEVWPHAFKDIEEALMACDHKELDMHQPIRVRVPFYDAEGKTSHRELIETTVGRLIFSEILPEDMRYASREVTKKEISSLVSDCFKRHGPDRTIRLLDEMKTLGFKYATRAGITISMTDMDIPARRDEIISETEKKIAQTNRAYGRGLLTAGEREQRVLELWTRASEEVAEEILKSIDRFNPIYIITDSGARGTKRQITQLSGMRGLMADPFGRLIEDLPIKSNFHEGLSVLEYFISTHGARKGLADTALRTADAGYLTRRLVDVAQDVIVRADDCGTSNGIYVSEIVGVEELEDRILGRYAFEPIVHPETGEILVEPGEEINERRVEAILEAGIRRIGIKSSLTCELRQGICAKCYGRDMARGPGYKDQPGKLSEVGTAVGIIAAQSIGEPGTQLTMRTFHTGGVAANYLTGVAEVKKKKQETLRELHEDIRRGYVSFDEGVEGMERERVKAVQAVLKVLEEQVRGLLRVVELFERRKPKGQAIITELGGIVVDIETKGLRKVIIHHDYRLVEPNPNAMGKALVEDIYSPETDEKIVEAGTELTEKIVQILKRHNIEAVTIRETPLVPYRGNLEVEVGQINLGEFTSPDRRKAVLEPVIHPTTGELLIPTRTELTRPVVVKLLEAGVATVKAGDIVDAGDRLTEGPLDPQKVLELQGIRGVQDYLVREIQVVYKSQGVDINDKHIEVIVRQMLRKRKIREPGDTRFLPGQVVDKFEFEDENTRVRDMDPPGTEGTADWELLGITEASLATESFLSAASFQKTTRVLTEAAVRGKKDHLVGLKENVIIGRLIPAGTGLAQYRNVDVGLPAGVSVSKPRQEAVEDLLRAEVDYEEEESLIALADALDDSYDAVGSNGEEPDLVEDEEEDEYEISEDALIGQEPEEE